jgi:hypothetical protein
MPSFLIVKLPDGGLPEVVDVVLAADGADPAVEVKRGYRGHGRYAILDWDSRVECDLAPGPVEAAAVEDQAARLEKAEPVEAPAE